MVALSEAMALYSGPRRTYEIFRLVAAEQRSLQEIFDKVPGDTTFMKSVVEGLVGDGLIQRSDTETFVITRRGIELLAELESTPINMKADAYRAAWNSEPPPGY